MPMIVPLSPSGTVKLSLMLTTLSNRRYSESGSGTTPCCCSKGYRYTQVFINTCSVLCEPAHRVYQLFSLLIRLQKSAKYIEESAAERRLNCLHLQ